MGLDQTFVKKVFASDFAGLHNHLVSVIEQAESFKILIELKYFRKFYGLHCWMENHFQENINGKFDIRQEDLVALQRDVNLVLKNPNMAGAYFYSSSYSEINVNTEQDYFWECMKELKQFLDKELSKKRVHFQSYYYDGNY